MFVSSVRGSANSPNRDLIHKRKCKRIDQKANISQRGQVDLLT
jgi:hypothetical protein